MRLDYGNIGRAERLSVRMDIDHADIEKVRPQLEVLERCAALNMPKNVIPGDLLKVNYSLTAEYLGNTAQALTAVNEICSQHPELVAAVKYEELKHGKMLLHEVLSRLDTLMQTVGPPR